MNKDCEITWGGYGHLASDRGELEPRKQQISPRSRGRSTVEFSDPGFDDVELELDGDDEREESHSLSSGGSFDSSAGRRGRAPLRA